MPLGLNRDAEPRAELAREVAAPGDLDHPKLRRFDEYWRSKRQGAKLPGRRQIDPCEIPDLLPSIAVIDVVRAEGRIRFRIRLYGTEHVERVGRDLTGQWVEDAFAPDAAVDIAAAYTRAVERKAPQYGRGCVPLEDREHVGYQRVIYPLASDGETVDALIGIYVFD